MQPLKIFCNLQLSTSDKELLLKELGAHQLLLPKVAASSVLALAEFDPNLLEADVVIGQPAPQDLLKSTKLRWLQITSAGYTRYDTPEFRQAMHDRNILVSNSSSVYDQPCAEHVLAFILAQSRGLPSALASSCSAGTAEWNALRAACLSPRGQRALILGYGAIGEKLAALLLPLGMEVIALRRKPIGREKVPVITPKELSAILPTIDHLINILPDSPETRGSINDSYLRQLKPGTVFYNIGRGTTVDQPALAAALQSKHLAAAWLDVTEPEPLPADHPLRKLPNCYITPHTAGGHYGEIASLLNHFLGNLRKFETGQELNNRIM